jgi:sensor histidine kinase YesM
LLQIKFSSRPVGFITVSIKDNGIGREKAAEQKSKDALKRKSYGMQITNDRIMLINNFFKINATVEIIDLKNELGAAAGTEVLIQVPVKQ